MKFSTIYERTGKLFIHSSSKTTSGLRIITPPVFVVEKENAHELAVSLQKCLAASKEGITHPKSFKGLFDPILNLAGVRSFSTFMKSAKCVEVQMRDKTVTFTPTRNEGSKGGFAHLPEKIQLTASGDEELGSVAIAALALAE